MRYGLAIIAVAFVRGFSLRREAALRAHRRGRQNRRWRHADGPRRIEDAAQIRLAGIDAPEKGRLSGQRRARISPQRSSGRLSASR